MRDNIDFDAGYRDGIKDALENADRRGISNRMLEEKGLGGYDSGKRRSAYGSWQDRIEDAEYEAEDHSKRGNESEASYYSEMAQALRDAHDRTDTFYGDKARGFMSHNDFSEDELLYYIQEHFEDTGGRGI